MVTKPQSNLPPQAQPWGRYVEESLANLERGTSINGQNSNNNLRQLNSSVQLLSQQQQDLQTQQNTLASQQATLASQQATLASQQAYLATFQTYTSTNAATVDTSSMGGIIQLRNLSLTFTLTRAASVLININANGWAYADHNSSTPMPTLRFGTSLIRSSTSYPSFLNTYGGNMGLFGNFSGTGRAGYEGALFGSGVISLPAGTHTFTAYWSLYMYGSSGYGYVNNASIIATVVG